MEYIYKYTDLSDGIVKYVGITKDLEKRIYQHKRDKLSAVKNWKIEYAEYPTRSDVEFLEGHLISLYGTAAYFNVAKSGFGKCSFELEDIPWKLYQNGEYGHSKNQIGRNSRYDNINSEGLARLAVFFDELGIEWEYRKKFPIPLNTGMHTADFYLPKSMTFVSMRYGSLPNEKLINIEFGKDVPYRIVSINDRYHFNCSNKYESYDFEWPSYSSLVKCDCGQYYFMGMYGEWECPCCGAHDGDHHFTVAMAVQEHKDASLWFTIYDEYCKMALVKAVQYDFGGRKFGLDELAKSSAGRLKSEHPEWGLRRHGKLTSSEIDAIIQLAVTGE